MFLANEQTVKSSWWCKVLMNSGVQNDNKSLDLNNWNNIFLR